MIGVFKYFVALVGDYELLPWFRMLFDILLPNVGLLVTGDANNFDPRVVFVLVVNLS